jgi:predicted RNase H-like HicB family nuclease
MRSNLECRYGDMNCDASLNFTLECAQEIDGLWIAEVPELPGVLAYGSSSAAAIARAEFLALRVIADRLENGESKPVSIHFLFHFLHEQLALSQSKERMSSLAVHWMESQASARISQDP